MSTSDYRKIHVAGVAGVGMNAVAQVLLAQGWDVSGSDRFLDSGTRLPVLDKLEAQGLRLFPQDGSGLTRDTVALVLSTAVEADNPDRRRADALGIRERHRSEVLVDLLGAGKSIGVAGTSGKTTCTGMLGWVLEECGLDPWVVNGGAVVNWVSPTRIGNVRVGGDAGWRVAELDESDRSLLRFHPRLALINTITADHFPFDETVELFRRFAAQVQEAIVCGPGVRDLLRGATAAALVEADAASVDLPFVVGEHNRVNARNVAALARLAGAEDAAVRRALSRFRGVERRLQLHTPLDAAVRVFDDYGHNPEKIQAALRAVRPEGGRLLALWRPHGFAPLRANLDALLEVFAEELRAEDRLFLLPVFFAGGTVARGAEVDRLAEGLRGRGCGVLACADFREARKEILAGVRPGDVVLSMGARDPELPVFATALAGERRVLRG